MLKILGLVAERTTDGTRAIYGRNRIVQTVFGMQWLVKQKYDVTVKIDDPAVYVATQRNVLLLHWKTTPTVDSISKARRVLAEATKGGQKFYQITLINKNGGMPSGSEARELMETMFKENQKNCVMMVNIIEEQGFLAAALRAMLTGIHLVLRPPYPVRITSTRAEAVALLAAQGKVSEARALLTRI